MEKPSTIGRIGLLEVVEIASIVPQAEIEHDILTKVHEPIENDVEISHFIPYDHFLTLLESKQLRMGRSDGQKKDALDSSLPEENISQISPLDQFIQSQFRFPTRFDGQAAYNDQQELRKRVFIHCWRRSWNQDERMWEVYGSGGRGVMIKSTSHRLLRSIMPQQGCDVKFGQVVYFPPGTVLPTFIPGLAIVAKKDAFQDDAEVRLLQIVSEHLFDSKKESMNLNVDLSVIFLGIVCGPSLNVDEVSSVKQALRNFTGLSIEYAISSQG